MERLLEMGRAFFAESGYTEMEFDPDTTAGMLRYLMDSDDGALFVADVGRLIGMAGALAYPFYFNAGHKTGQELFWWMVPEFRGGVHGVRLLHELERWARSVGCASFSMIALSTLPRAADIYARSGYRASDQSFIKVI